MALKEALINSATHLRTSALSSRRRQILDVAPLRLRFVSSIDTAHLCKSGRPHFISASYYKEKFFTDKITAPPLISDTATEIKSYANLFRVHAAERRKIEDRQIAVAKARQQMEKTARKETAPDEAKHLQEGDAATENPKVVLDKTPSQRNQAASPAKGAQAVERARDEQAKKEGQAEPAVQREEAEPQDLQSILYAEVEKILREEQEEEKKQQEKLQESA